MFLGYACHGASSAFPQPVCAMTALPHSAAMPALFTAVARSLAQRLAIYYTNNTGSDPRTVATALRCQHCHLANPSTTTRADEARVPRPLTMPVTGLGAPDFRRQQNAPRLPRGDLVDESTAKATKSQRLRRCAGLGASDASLRTRSAVSRRPT